jgi:hypothetical protein
MSGYAFPHSCTFFLPFFPLTKFSLSIRICGMYIGWKCKVRCLVLSDSNGSKRL